MSQSRINKKQVKHSTEELNKEIEENRRVDWRWSKVESSPVEKRRVELRIVKQTESDGWMFLLVICFVYIDIVCAMCRLFVIVSFIFKFEEDESE